MLNVTILHTWILWDFIIGLEGTPRTSLQVQTYVDGFSDV